MFHVERFLDRDEGSEVDTLEDVTAMQTFVFDLDDEVHIDLLRMEVLYKVVGCLSRTTSGKEVVMDQYHVVFIDGVDVHFDGIDTIFLRERFLNHSRLLKRYPTKEVLFEEVPKFPEVRRDLALVLKKDITFAQVEQAARGAEKRLLKSVSLFDVYEGKGITEGFKSYAVSFILQDKEKTLADKQIEATMGKIQKTLESQLGATIRG